MGRLDRLGVNMLSWTVSNRISDSQAQRFRLALDMADAGIQMYRQRMRREHPDAGAEEIEAKVQGWLMSRPGDYPGIS